MLTVALHEPATLDGLAERWQAFEAQVACSFFQGWAWVGCLAAERFPDPVLIEARWDGDLVAMALFNRRRTWPNQAWANQASPNQASPNQAWPNQAWRNRPWSGGERLFLGETGHPAWDCVFVEHNGVLLAPGYDGALQPCLAAAQRGRTLVLSGIDAAQLQAATALGAACIAQQTRLAPRVDLAAIAAKGARYLDQLSANTRYQLRRSARRYAEAGALEVTRAASPAQAHAFLEALAALHQAAWTGRGRPGAFARPEFARFHHALIDRTDAVDLLRITAGGQVVGYLHNFRSRGGVNAYQSGFDYAGAPEHAKPGLTCHHLAIEHYLTEGMAVYDFLAGDDRYKTSLATGSVPLHWVTLAPKWSWPGLAGRLKQVARQAQMAISAATSAVRRR